MRALLVRFPPVLLVVTVLHLAVFPDLRVATVAAEALLLLSVASGAAAGAERGALVGFVAGLVADLFVQTPFGLSALVYSIAGYAVGRFEASILRSAWWIPVLTSAIASAAGMVAFALAGTVLGQPHLLTARLGRIALVVGMLNGLLAWPFVRVARWSLAAGRTREAILR